MFSVGPKAFAHEDFHVVDMNAAPTFQQAAAAGDAPEPARRREYHRRKRKAGAVQIVSDLGDAGQSYQPNAETDSQADTILQSGQQQYQQDLQQQIDQLFQHHGCRMGRDGQHCD
jgi:hypothetical protein